MILLQVLASTSWLCARLEKFQIMFNNDSALGIQGARLLVKGGLGA